MIRQNLFYKLMALGIAVALWFYVNGERNPQARKVLTVPLEVRNLARGYTAEPATREVGITIQGGKSAVDAVRREDAAAWIDLRRLKTGPALVNAVVRVDARVAGAPDSDLAVTVSPRSVRVRVEAIRSRRLPVEVKFVTAPPLGYSYSEPVIEPDSVAISGKASEVARVKRILLALAARNPGKPIDDYCPVTPTDSAGNAISEVTLDPDKAHLKVGVVDVPATKAVVVSENVVGRPKFPARVTGVAVSPPSVTLEGKPKDLMGISTIGTEEVSVEGAAANVTREVAVRVPAGVRVVGSGRVHVSILISGKE